jgi:cyclophilin family peptidyl-prolyl cis-trans isomerase
LKRSSFALVATILGMLLAACANANPSTVAIMGTTDANVALSTQAANDLATSAYMTQNAPPTATPEPIVPVVVAEYTAAADAQTPEQLCAAAVPAKEPETRKFTKADQVVQPGIDYRAIFCTAVGPVYVDLTEKETPQTVNNFVFLAQKGYYNNTTFHRVLANFMAQGGDPTATGTGDPGYKFNDEIRPALTFDAPGKLAMANSGPNTNGSQFFITVAPQPNLDGGYTLFGLVVKGLANVSKIELRDPDKSPTKPGTSLNTVLIITDPTKVLLTDNPPPTQADVEKALDSINTMITPELANTLENQKISQTTADAVSAAPEAARKDLEALFTANHHQYRVGSTLNNKACDVSQLQFYSVSYTMDAYATTKDAANAISDPAMEKIAMESGFTEKKTSPNLTFPYYTASETACTKPVVHAMTYWRRGNFIITAQIAWPVDAAQGLDVLDKVLSQFVGGRLYEPLLTTVLYSNIQ